MTKSYSIRKAITSFHYLHIQTYQKKHMSLCPSGWYQILVWPMDYICCCSAASDGGRAVIGRPFRVKSSSLVSLTDSDLLVLLYISMVKRPKAEYTLSATSSGAPRSSQKAAVTASWVSHSFHAVLLPTCAKCDTVSQSVKA